MRIGRMLTASWLTMAIALAPAGAQEFYFRTGGPPVAGNLPAPQSTPLPFSFAILGPSAVAVGHSATFTTRIQNAIGATSFSIQSGSLPAGVSLDPSTGAVGGTTTQKGVFNAVIHGSDAGGRNAIVAFSVAVVDTFGMTGYPATTVMAGHPYQAIFTAFGGDQPYRFTADPLPPGLTLLSGATTATIEGTPTTSNNYDIVVTATDANNLRVAKPFRLSVSPHLNLPLSVSGSGAAAVQAGSPYSTQFIPSGGAGGYQWSIDGSLPSGLTLSPSTGLLSGTPEIPGTYPGLKVVLTDAASNSVATGEFSISVFAPLSATWNPPTSYLTGDAVSASASAAGGHGSYSWSVDGALPPGVTLSSSGTLSGTVATAGTYGPVALKVTDGVRTASTGAVTFVVSEPPPLTIASPQVPAGHIGQQFQATSFAADGGKPGYSYSVTGTTTSLPPGMTIDANGVLSGMPQTYYDETISVVATDQAGTTASTAPFRLHVFGPLTIYGIPQQYTQMGDFYQATQPRAYGGTEEGYVYEMAQGVLPPGLELDTSTGLISGLPTEIGSSGTLSIRVTDSDDNQSVSPVFSIVVQPSTTEVPLIEGYSGDVAFPARTMVGDEVAFTIVGMGGYGGPYRYTENPAVPLPSGLTVDPDSGVVSGTPQSAGIHPISILITDTSQGDDLSGYADVGNLVVMSFSVAGDEGFGRVGEPYSMPFQVRGGSGDVTFSLGSGSLPAGLAIDPTTGLVSGVPTEVGTWMISMVAHDNVTGLTAESDQSVVQIAPAANACYSRGVIGPGAEVGLGIMGTLFSPGIIDDSQVKGYSLNWSTPGHAPDGDGAPLPPGVQWYSFGMVFGAPTATGTYGPIVVTVEDNEGGSGPCGAGSASAPFMVESIDPIRLTTSSLPEGYAGQPYSATLSASDGKPGYWYSYRIDQTLPPSIHLNQATGVISGTTNMRGSFPIDITVTDAWGFQDIRSFVLKIN